MSAKKVSHYQFSFSPIQWKRQIYPNFKNRLTSFKIEIPLPAGTKGTFTRRMMFWFFWDAQNLTHVSNLLNYVVAWQIHNKVPNFEHLKGIIRTVLVKVSLIQPVRHLILTPSQCSKRYEISDMGFFIKIYNQIVILDHWYWSFLMVYNHFCCKK